MKPHNKIADYVDYRTGELLFSESFYDPGSDPEAVRERGDACCHYGGRPFKPTPPSDGEQT